MSAADWQQLLDQYYRKVDIYDMQWIHVNMDSSKVAGAPFGGPIGTNNNTRQTLTRPVWPVQRDRQAVLTAPMYSCVSPLQL